jgi:uncharacterized protein YjbI with pentapeptide repeats
MKDFVCRSAVVSEESDRSHDRIWYVRQNGRVSGPFPSGQLRRLLDDGVVMREEEVSEDQQGWRRACDVAEVSPLRFRKPHEAAGASVRAANERRRDTRKALRSLAILGTMAAAAITAAWLYEGKSSLPVADCTVAAGPRAHLSPWPLDRLAATGLDLTGALLSNASLAGARLDRALLEGADLRFAHLAAAQLAYARAGRALFKGANLRAADLAYADLGGADLGYADLTGAVLGGANLEGARLDHAIWVDGRRCVAGSLGGCLAAP